MENQRSGGSTLRRLTSPLKRHKLPSSAPPTDPATSTPGPSPGSESQPLRDYDDGQRAQRRYEEAAAELKGAIKRQKGLDFEDLSGGPEGFDDSQFKKKINAILSAHESSIKDRKGWSTLTRAVECVFTALSPFAKNFLMVAKDAQAVTPFTLLLMLCADNRAESIWSDLRWPPSFNNGFSLKDFYSDSRSRIKRLQERQKL